MTDGDTLIEYLCAACGLFVALLVVALCGLGAMLCVGVVLQPTWESAGWLAVIAAGMAYLLRMGEMG